MKDLRCRCLKSFLLSFFVFLTHLVTELSKNALLSLLAVRTRILANRGLRNSLRPIATSAILDTKIDPFLQKNSLVMGCSGCCLISLRNGTKLHR